MNPSPRLQSLRFLLATLRGLYQAHWTTHWKVAGTAAYADHLLFERLYTAVAEEIDTLGEKIVGYYGSGALDDVEQAEQVEGFLRKHAGGDLYGRALRMELALQGVLTTVYQVLKDADDLPLALDDFLMATANAHETSVFLLRQRTSLPD